MYREMLSNSCLYNFNMRLQQCSVEEENHQFFARCIDDTMEKCAHAFYSAGVAIVLLRWACHP